MKEYTDQEFAAVEKPAAKDSIKICPDCGRQKARNVAQTLHGYCPKWYAIRDPEAEEDCRRATAEKPAADGLPEAKASRSFEALLKDENFSKIVEKG